MGTNTRVGNISEGTMLVGVSDKVLMPWLEGKEYLDCSDEGEAVGIAGGFYLATGRKGTAFFSADGFMNALNAITSWIIPEGIEMHIVISIGRTEPSHFVATEITKPTIDILSKYDHKITFEFVEKDENVRQ